MTLRAVYLDLDGTLLGRGGSLLHDGDGRFSLAGVRALEACARAGAEVVIYSGRRRVELGETARLLGASAYVFEAGCGLVDHGEVEWLTGDLQPTETETVHARIEAGGAPALLLRHFAGRLHLHAPWHEDREASHLFRGDVEADEAAAVLAEAGHADLAVLDNGAASAGGRTLHLVPAGVSKARAVARHMQRAGLAPEECLAVGDSREDLAVSEVAGAFWLVANADPDLIRAAASRPNVRVAEAGHGAGVYEAVVSTLVER